MLAKTKSNNLLIQACRLYLSIPYIIYGIHALAIFGYKVVLPYLNFSEKGNQNHCVKLFPQMYQDLLQGKMDTLSEYSVEYSFEFPLEGNSVVNSILKHFTNRVAKDFALQKGREYGFGADFQNNVRANRLDLMEEEVLSTLPTNNISCERALAKFDMLMKRSGRSPNNHFQAAGIKDDIVLGKTTQISTFISKTTKKLIKLLDEKEKEYLKKQKDILCKKLQKSAENAQKVEEKNEKLLKLCKTWGGPFTEFSELEEATKNIKNEATLKKMLKSEISFRKLTCPRDVIERPDLYRLNLLSIIQLKENLTILLTTQQNLNFIEIPGEEQLMEIISKIQTN